MNKSLAKAIDQALTALRRPDAKLLRQYGGRDAGFYIAIPHKSFRIGDDVAAKLLECEDVRILDTGLLPGHPQSWTLARRRA